MAVYNAWVNEARLRALLDDVAQGRLDTPTALSHLSSLPFEDLGFANVDHHRALRQGAPEVILAQGKTPEQVAAIAEKIAEHAPNLLITRADEHAYNAVHARLPQVVRHPLSRTIALEREAPPQGRGTVLVVAAGTSDLPVAEEAVITARCFGGPVESLFDVGVAGLHRLLGSLDRLRQASVIVVVAGMEGALPSVVGGLVAAPVIAVPTSVGYGTGTGGWAALLGALNSCASNVCAVNIDNGFGAAMVASAINRKS